MLHDFDVYLASPFSVDYWSDEGIGIASNKLADFSIDDWKQLRLAIESRDSAWLMKCAEVLGNHENILAFELIMKLASNTNSEIQIAALDSANSLINHMSIDKSTIEQLKAIVSNVNSSSLVVNKMLDSLKNKIYLLQY